LYSFALYDEERGGYKQGGMNAYLGSGQEKSFYDVYMQRMHKSGRVFLNMKEQEGFM